MLYCYICYSRTRRGTPTHILLHLCVSLVVLQAVLYLAEAVTDSKATCTAANIFRMYLILVSLLWNAVEAVNMYLMLIKVFNSEIDKFIYKAAAVAWGKDLLNFFLAV